MKRAITVLARNARQHVHTNESTRGNAVRAFNIATMIMVLFGAICLGLQGQFQIDLIGLACGIDSPWPRAVYALIGLSGLWQAVWLATHKPTAQLV